MFSQIIYILYNHWNCRFSEYYSHSLYWFQQDIKEKLNDFPADKIHNLFLIRIEVYKYTSKQHEGIVLNMRFE